MDSKRRMGEDTSISFQNVDSCSSDGVTSEKNNALLDIKLNDWKLICINAVTTGLEMVSSVVFTLVPPMLLKLGFSESKMSMIFGVGKSVLISLSTTKYLNAPDILILDQS